MRTLLIIVIISTGLFFCRSKTGQQSVKAKPIADLSNDSINYHTQLEPIFRQNCSPCHFPGGKMYARMPFDQANTIIIHKAGILRRIKNEEQVALIKKFLGPTN